MRVRKAVPKASSDDNRVVQVQSVLPFDSYRGRKDVRWRFRMHKGKPTFEVTCECKCGLWWGWVHETRLDEFLELLLGGCKSCCE